MRLFIIGNGFDLAHDLPTQYWDFRTYLSRLYPDFLKSFEEHYQIYAGISEEYKRKLLWNTLETNLANIDEDVIIENALALDMGLESGPTGIEDTLRIYFKEEYQYIDKLAVYLKRWVRTIKIRGAKPITSAINNNTNDLFINFNYTSVLENVYNIDSDKVVHIHGSLYDKDDDPILGHGNQNRIENIKARKNHAQISYNEVEVSICSVVNDYYNATYKNVRNYMYKLTYLARYAFNEIIVIGHSVAGIDLPYFEAIDDITRRKSEWKVYYFREYEKEDIHQSLIDLGLVEKRFELIDSREFYNLKEMNK